MTITRNKLRAFLTASVAFALNAAGGAAFTQPAIHQMADLKIAATIPVGKHADWVAISPTSVWIGSKEPNAVSEIDPKTSQVIAKILLPGAPCAGLTITGESLWTPLCGPVPLLAEVDMKTKMLARLMIVGPPAGEGGIVAGAGSLWLVKDKNGSLLRIDPVSGTVRETIAIPSGSFNPVFAGDRIFVTRFDGAEVTVVDTAIGKVTGHLLVGAKPRFITAGAGAVWALSQSDGTLSRIEALEKPSVTTIPLHIPGTGGDIAFGDGRVWVTLMGTPISVVDAATSAPLCQWKGAGGDSLGVGHGAIWLTNLKEGTVSRINLSDLPADCYRGAAVSQQ